MLHDLSTRENLNKAMKDTVEDIRKNYSQNKAVDFRKHFPDQKPGESLQAYEDRYALMKTALRHPMQVESDMGALKLGKASLSTSGNLVWYDLRVPALSLVPWLTPLRDKLPRKSKAAGAGTAAHWLSIFASSLNAGGFLADPWINQGSRAPLYSFSATNETATYTTIGNDGSVTFEAESAAVGVEDANALARFYCLEQLMVKEEDALIGGNADLPLGTANTPTGTSGTDAYVAIVGLTYAGYRNYSSNAIATGVTGQKVITTPDGNVMTVNGGNGVVSAISAHLSLASTISWTQKAGEVAWAVYIGTSNSLSALTLQGFVTVPSIAAATYTVAGLTNTGQAANASAVQTDYSYNNGSQGGGTNQVTAFDGIMTQCWNAVAAGNAQVTYQAGATLTSSGRGSVVEIDTILLNMWNTSRVSPTVIWVNAQEMKNITSKVLNGTTAPLLRYERDSSDGEYHLTASGIIEFYYNPYLPGGGRKIPVMIHPTLPPGTIMMYAEELPAYFKNNETPAIAEVLCRRDYYSIDWALRTRAYEFGVYAEEVLAVYAPFALSIITGIGNG
jgi:hypothetical protein